MYVHNALNPGIYENNMRGYDIMEYCIVPSFRFWKSYRAKCSAWPGVELRFTASIVQVLSRRNWTEFSVSTGCVSGDSEWPRAHSEMTHRARIFKCLWGPGIDQKGMNSASLCSLAGRYDNPIPPQCLAPVDFLTIPGQRTMTQGLTQGQAQNRCFKEPEVSYIHVKPLKKTPQNG